MRSFFNMLAWGDLPRNREMPNTYLESFQAAFIAFAVGTFRRDYESLQEKILAKA